MGIGRQGIQRESNGVNSYILSLDKICFGMPFFLIGLIWAVYFLAPDFFLSYVLAESKREFQVVEIVTFLAALTGGIILVYCAWRMWKHGWHWAACVVAVNAGATLFFAGEEISWGQSYFFWATPDWWNTHVAYETNFHNSQISVTGFHTLAGLYQVAMFGILPGIGFFQDKVPFVSRLRPSIPELPVVAFVLVGFVYRESKNIYMWLYPHDQFFQDFIWGLNEHREMLVAVALLFYAVYRLRVIKTLGGIPHPK